MTILFTVAVAEIGRPMSWAEKVAPGLGRAALHPCHGPALVSSAQYLVGSKDNGGRTSIGWQHFSLATPASTRMVLVFRPLIHARQIYVVVYREAVVLISEMCPAPTCLDGRMPSRVRSSLTVLTSAWDRGAATNRLVRLCGGQKRTQDIPLRVLWSVKCDIQVTVCWFRILIDAWTTECVVAEVFWRLGWSCRRRLGTWSLLLRRRFSWSGTRTWYRRTASERTRRNTTTSRLMTRRADRQRSRQAARVGHRYDGRRSLLTPISPSSSWPYRRHQQSGVHWARSTNSCNSGSPSSAERTKAGRTRCDTTCRWTSASSSCRRDSVVRARDTTGRSTQPPSSCSRRDPSGDVLAVSDGNASRWSRSVCSTTWRPARRTICSRTRPTWRRPWVASIWPPWVAVASTWRRWAAATWRRTSSNSTTWMALPTCSTRCRWTPTTIRAVSPWRRCRPNRTSSTPCRRRPTATPARPTWRPVGRAVSWTIRGRSTTTRRGWVRCRPVSRRPRRPSCIRRTPTTATTRWRAVAGPCTRPQRHSNSSRSVRPAAPALCTASRRPAASLTTPCLTSPRRNPSISHCQVSYRA